MRRLLGALVLAGLVFLPGALRAETGFSIGASLEFFHPLDAEMYGGTMASNSWGRDIADIDSSTGRGRNRFYTINRYNGIFSPGLQQAVKFDFGLSVELAERWMYLTWAPNKDVDINFDRTVVPITLTGRYTFMRASAFRPALSAGAGCYYFWTHISGRDLYDQKYNANYPGEGVPEDSDSTIPMPEEYFRTGRDFKKSGWFFGYHVGAGFDLEMQPQLLLSVDLRWSVIPAESIEAVRVREYNVGSWHWEEGKIKGDAGGLHGLVSVAYIFMR